MVSSNSILETLVLFYTSPHTVLPVYSGRICCSPPDLDRDPSPRSRTSERPISEPHRNGSSLSLRSVESLHLMEAFRRIQPPNYGDDRLSRKVLANRVETVFQDRTDVQPMPEGRARSCQP